MSNPKKKKVDTCTWGQCFRFIFHAKFCWPLIFVSMALSLLESEIAMMIIGDTAEMYAGNFERPFVIALIKFGVASSVISLIASILQSLASSITRRNVSSVLWSRMLRMQASSSQAQSADSMLTAMTADVTSTVGLVISIVTRVPSTINILRRSFQMSKEVDPQLLWPMFLLVPLYLLYGVFVGRWLENTTYGIQREVGTLTAFFSERLRNMDAVKAYGTEKKEAEKGTLVARLLLRANMRRTYVGCIQSAYFSLSGAICEILAIVAGTFAMRAGRIDLEGWMEYFMVMPMFCAQLRNIVDFWINGKQMKGHAARCVQIWNAPVEQSGKETANAAGDIVLKNVTFGYEDKKALDNVSLTIPGGKLTAIVGPIGSGKSTTLNLIERIYTPASGSITVGGKDIADMKLDDYRGKLAYIQQDAGMFSGTVREAICYGVKRTVSQSELESAAATCGILSDIQALPDGFDTKVALWGDSLSGGQRQKMVIAREMLRNAEVLLLDEPTSALDVNTASSIHNTLADHFAGKTIITVTHDLRLIAKSSQIVVMDGGHVAGCGPHEELMKTCPLYRELVEEQSYQEVYQA